MPHSAGSPELSARIESAVKIMRRGGIVVFPTDTVYGLGCDPQNWQAVQRIYRVKQRPRDMAMPLLAADTPQVETVAEMTAMAEALARTFWPGQLTLVLMRKAAFPEYATGTGGTVAVRVPCHVVPVSIARHLGTPIVGTSANLSGRPSALTAEAASDQLDALVDLVIDGGPSQGGTESTLVDATGTEPIVLRQGAVPAGDIVAAWRRHMDKTRD